jgi:hypothetical protein
MWSGICTTEKTVFLMKNVRFISFSVWSAIFRKICILQQCLDPNLNPNPNPNFYFGFGSSQIIRILSDSDPQHSLKLF